MFSSFQNLLWPVKEFLDFFFGNMFQNVLEGELDLAKLESDIKTNTFGEIDNLVLSSIGINKRFLKNLPIECSKGSVDKIYIKFPKTFLKDKIEIKIEDISLTLTSKVLNEIDAKDYLLTAKKQVEAATKMLVAPVMKIINNAINNVEVNLKNISVYFQPLSSSQTVSNSDTLKLLISSITYQKAKDNPKDTLFLFNKQISVKNFLVQIDEEGKTSVEEDKKFFKLCEENNEKELINFYTKENCILVTSTQNSENFTYCSLDIKFEKNESDKEKLIVTSNIDKIEMMLTKNQLNILLQVSYFMNELYQKLMTVIQSVKYNSSEEEKIIPPTKTNPLNILTHKISNIDVKFGISNINLIILENSTSQNIFKPKMWLMYDFYYKKYYLSTDDVNKDNFNTNNISSIQRHFCYLEDNFITFNIAKINIQSKLNLNESENILRLNISEINSRYVEPNSMPIKKDLIVINNIITNEVEKYFDERFSKIFLNSIKYGHYAFNLLNMNGIEVLMNSELHVENADKDSNTSSTKENYNTSTQDKVYYSYHVKANLNDINFDFNYVILLKIHYLLLINLEEYAAILEKKVKVVNAEFDGSSKFSSNTNLPEDSSGKNLTEGFSMPKPRFDDIVTPQGLPEFRRGSVQEKILRFEKKVKEAMDESQKTSLVNGKRGQLSSNLNSNNNITQPQSKVTTFSTNNETNLQFFTEFKILINFKLNIKLTALNHGNQLFKDFYNFNIQNLFDNKTTIYQDNKNTKNNMNRYLLKIGEDVSKEHIILRLSTCEVLLIKQFTSDNLTLFGDIHKIFCFYSLNGIYFPILTYKNSAFTPVSGLNSFTGDHLSTQMNKLESIKSWIFLMNYKKFYSTIDFDNSFANEARYFLNSHHIKKNENFIMDEIKRRQLLQSYVRNTPIEENQIALSLNLNKIDLTINYIYLTHLIEFLKVTDYSIKYLKIFTSALDWKYYYNLPPKIKESVTNLHYTVDLKINEINIIGFSNINLNVYETNLVLHNQENLNIHFNSNFSDVNKSTMSDFILLEKYLNTDENIFNIIENPFFKIQLTNLNLTLLNCAPSKNYLILSLDNFKILIRKNDNIYHDIKIKYQIFFQSIYEEENFDHFLYKGISNVNCKRNLVSVLLKFENKFKNSPQSIFENVDPSDLQDFLAKVMIYQNRNISYNISMLALVDDIVISPLFNNLEESVKLLEEIKKEYYKMKIILKNDYYNSYGQNLSYGNNFKNEINQNDKIFNLQNYSAEVVGKSEQSSVHTNTNSISLTSSKLDLSLNIQISRIVLDMFSYTVNKNLTQSVEPKHKMRLITEIEGVTYEEVKKESGNNCGNIDMSTASAPRVLDLSISRINSIFLKNLDFKNSQNILTNKCQNIAKENSYWRKIGFMEIFNMQNLQTLLTECNQNLKSEFIINSIEFLFCKDSLKYFLKFISKSKTDLNYIVNLVLKYSDSDRESVITELEMIQDRFVNEQIQFPGKSVHDSSIEYKKVNSNYHSRKNLYASNEKERAQSADVKFDSILLKNNSYKGNTGNKLFAESWKENKLDSLYVLDNNSDKRSNSSSVRISGGNSNYYSYAQSGGKKTLKANANNNFHSDAFHSGKENEGLNIGPTKTEEKEIEMYNNMNNCPYNNINSSSNEKEFASKITEKLNLFFVVHFFKFYMFEGKDFEFVDTYTGTEVVDANTSMSSLLNMSDHLNNEAKNKFEFVYTSTGIHRNDNDFSVTINLNPSLIQVMDDYLTLHGKSNKVDKEVLGVSRRLRSIQRNYNNFILLAIEDIESKFFYYNNSPVIFSHLLEIKSFAIKDFIRDSKFKKIISAYDFEDLNQFLTLKLDLIKSAKNEIEVCLLLQMTPLNILIDQLSLKFLIKFFRVKLDNLGKDASPSDNQTLTMENQSQSVTISQINAENMNMNTSNTHCNTNTEEKQNPLTKFLPRNSDLKNYSFYARRFIIQDFFINFCYNAQKIHLENIKDLQLLELINISSINDLKLDIKYFDFKGKKSLTEVLMDVYDFWKDDILKEQIINAYLSSISVIRPFKNIVGGFVDIFKQPYLYYAEDKSIQEGVVSGVKNFVVSFSTEALTLGEKVRLNELCKKFSINYYLLKLGL